MTNMNVAEAPFTVLPSRGYGACEGLLGCIYAAQMFQRMFCLKFRYRMFYDESGRLDLGDTWDDAGGLYVLEADLSSTNPGVNPAQG